MSAPPQEFGPAADTFSFVELQQIFIDLSQACTDLFRFTGVRSGRQRSTEPFDVCRRCAPEWEDARVRITKVLDSMQMIQEASNSAQDVYDALLAKYEQSVAMVERLEAQLQSSNDDLDAIRGQLAATASNPKSNISNAWKQLTHHALGNVRGLHAEDDSRHAGPRGRLTLVAGDVAGAAVSWEQRPQAMTSAMQTLRETVISLAAEYQGFATRPEDGGDAFLVAFQDTVAAVQYTTALQTQLLTVAWEPDLLQLPVASVVYSPGESSTALLWRGLRVRLGVYSGIPTCVVGASGTSGYRGPPVTGALGLLLHAAGGETVLTADVFNRLRVAGALDGLVVRCRGMKSLRGVAARQLVYSVLPQGLAGRANGTAGIYHEDTDSAMAEMKLEWWIMSVKGTPEAREIAEIKKKAKDADAAKAQLAQLESTVAMLEDRAVRAEAEAKQLAEQVKVLISKKMGKSGGVVAVHGATSSGVTRPAGTESDDGVGRGDDPSQLARKPRKGRRKTVFKAIDDGGAAAAAATAVVAARNQREAEVAADEVPVRGALRAFPLGVDAIRPEVLRILLEDGEQDVLPPQGVAAGAAAVLMMHRSLRRALLSSHGLLHWVNSSAHSKIELEWPVDLDPLLFWLPPGSSVMPDIVSFAGEGSHDPWIALRHIAGKRTLLSKSEEMDAFVDKKWGDMSSSGLAAIAQIMIVFRQCMALLLKELASARESEAAAVAFLKQTKTNGALSRRGSLKKHKTKMKRGQSSASLGGEDVESDDDVSPTSLAHSRGGTMPTSRMRSRAASLSASQSSLPASQAASPKVMKVAVSQIGVQGSTALPPILGAGRASSPPFGS